MNKKSLIQDKTLDFITDIFGLVKILPRNLINAILIKQMIRSVTSIGANIEEALGSNTKKEFTYCMNIAKKEARESAYWLRIMLLNNPKLKKEINASGDECIEIINILTKIVKTSSQK